MPSEAFASSVISVTNFYHQSESVHKALDSSDNNTNEKTNKRKFSEVS